MKDMKANRLLAVLHLAFFVFPVFCENHLKNFYSLDLIESAELRYRNTVLSANNCERYFVPKISLSGSCGFSGSLGNDYFNGQGSGGISVSQWFPGFVGVDWYFSGNGYGFSEFWDCSKDFSYSVTPGIRVSVPLVFSSAGVKILDGYGRNYGKELLRYGNLSYKTELFAGKKNFSVTAGSYLYYQELVDCYEERINLLEEQSRDYEKLFELGKINYLEMQEKSSEILSLLKQKQEAKSNLIETEMKLREIGLLPEKCGESLEDFLEFWIMHYREQKENFGDYYCSDELEKSKVLVQLYSNAETIASEIPRFETDVSFSSDYTDSGIPDFTDAGWKINFSLNIPLFPDCTGGSAGRRLKNYGELSALQLKGLERRQAVTKKRREAQMTMLESYCEGLEKRLQLEEQRLLMVEKMVTVGKAPEFDSRWQKNVCQLARMEWRFGLLQKLALMADFY